ncbi:MAG: PadR family transcriptional regulator [Aeromicrobium sp.]|uniref:PadR family transcriptional regulator n=1 Tax=Aeromicrobium sp. TaxID=1871063 RepID=UPI0039E6DF3D
MHIDKDLVAASATPLVLAILAESDSSYGYAIAKRVTELSGGRMTWTDGMLYPLLHRLERLGFVSSSWQRAEDTGRRRKHYTITDAGRAALAERRAQWGVVSAALESVWASLRSAPAPAPTQGGGVA